MSLLDDRRTLLTKRTIRQSGEINKLLLSHQNYTTVKEQVLLYDVFQMIVEAHQEMTELSEVNSEENWFPEIDENVFTFRHKVQNRLKDALETRSKNKSRSSASRSSRS